MTDIQKILQDTIDTGEIIEIIYHGGSNPGTARKISPISFKGQSIRARDIESGKQKNYSINKIQLQCDTQYKPQPLPQIKNLSDYLEPYKPSIINAGWSIEADERHISLFRIWKNGNRRKTPDVYISKSEWSNNIHGDPDTQDIYPKHKPWYVTSKHAPTAISYKYIDKAFARFIEFAEQSTQIHFNKSIL